MVTLRHGLIPPVVAIVTKTPIIVARIPRHIVTISSIEIIW